MGAVIKAFRERNPQFNGVHDRVPRGARVCCDALPRSWHERMLDVWGASGG